MIEELQSFEEVDGFLWIGSIVEELIRTLTQANKIIQEEEELVQSSCLQIPTAQQYSVQTRHNR
ncbi:MAG: hypothetical protein PG981_000736 [Wolbachia endosymbiont of Ctenocephalides orientis wCori]|nr:MAG: hypothetical protein PG981_000736 [Wolbachia endosymbiont of Ctenocephalides orientis wCori]